MELLKKIQKNDEIRLLKCDEVKRFIKNNDIYLKRYKLEYSIKRDEDFFYFECLIQTLKNKEAFEGCFVKAYDDMIDYWQALNYEERKRLINIEIDQIKKNMNRVIKENQSFYLPCMNEKINRVYDQEMVLFELNQYNRLRFDCRDQIEVYHLNFEMIQAHFTSLQLVKGNEDDYWAYCPINHTLYHFVLNRESDKFTFIGFNGHLSEFWDFIDFFEEGDEDGCLLIMIKNEWISQKMIQKMEKILERRK